MDLSLIIDNGSPWPEVRELAQAADALGAYAVYLCDHFMDDTADGSASDAGASDAGMLECTTLLGALGPLTSQVWLGALVMGSTYRHPAVVANAVTALDHVSDGRAIAGIGAGWQVNEHAAYGIDLLPPAARSDRFEESAAVISGLLRERRSTYAGKLFQLHDAPNQPAPLQERLPVLVAGGGERRTLPTAARYADVWHTWAAPEAFAAKSAKLDEACAAIGRAPGEIRRATGLPGPVGDLAAALEGYRAVCDEFVVFDWPGRTIKATVAELRTALA